MPSSLSPPPTVILCCWLPIALTRWRLLSWIDCLTTAKRHSRRSVLWLAVRRCCARILPSRQRTSRASSTMRARISLTGFHLARRAPALPATWRPSSSCRWQSSACSMCHTGAADRRCRRSWPVKSMWRSRMRSLQYRPRRAVRSVCLASARQSRAPRAPDTPTIAEAGLAGFQSSTDVSLLAPAGTPEPIIARVHGALVAALRVPQVRERLLDLGAILIGGSPTEFPGYLAQESAKWRDVIRERGIKLQQ